MRLLPIAVVSLLCVTTPAWSWETVLPGDGSSGNGASLAVRADGDLILAHCIRAKNGSVSRSVVGRFSGRTGKRRWQVTVERGGFCINPHLVLTAKGDPIISKPLARLSRRNGTVVWSNRGEGPSALALRADGSLIATNPSDHSVSALDASTGEMLWSTVLDLRPRGIAIQPGGDVVVTAHGDGGASGPPNPFAVVALDGTSGAERWRYAAFGTADYINWNDASAIAVDVAGDVVAAGFVSNLLAPPPARDWDQQPLVVKLAGDSGTERWSRLMPLPGGGDATPVSAAVTADGQVVVAINRYSSSTTVVAKLSGESGDTVWQAAWPGDPDFDDYVEDLTVDAAGDVIAFGTSAGRVAVRKYVGSSGEPSWHRSLVARSDPLEDFLYPEAVAVDANGSVAVAGSTQRGGTHALRLHLIGFRDAVAGKRLAIRDDGARRTIRLELRDPRIQPAPAGGAGDPQREGATLAFASASGGSLALALPAEGWKPRGSRGGFVYAGTEDGCTAVTWKAGALRARCASGDDGFTIAEPLGEVSVRLAVGAPQGFSQCAIFGGTIVADRAATGGEPGRFTAVDAPPPASCS